MQDCPPILSIDGAIATIMLRSPQVANRLSPSDLRVLGEHLAEVNANHDVLVLRFTSEGKYFCSGYDIGALAASTGGGGAGGFGDLIDAIERARPVTIAAIQGGVYGGGTDLCLACDFRVGTPACNMFMPAVRLGLHFYRGGMERYVSRLGLNAAKRLFLTADRIAADEMLQIGFLTELADATEFAARVEELSGQLAGMAPLALLGMKRHLNDIACGRLDPAALQADILRAESSQDLREGGAAWMEKRTPKFRGL